MKNILVLIANGNEAVETLVPVDILNRMGANVELASVDGVQVKLQDGPKIVADKLLTDIKDFKKYDAIVLPGGEGHMTFKNSSKVKELVNNFYKEDKLVAAICASAGLLGDWGLLDDRTATAYPGFDLASKVKWTKNLSETHKNTITGKGPGGAAAFGFAIGRYLFSEDTVNTVLKTTFFEI